MHIRTRPEVCTLEPRRLLSGTADLLSLSTDNLVHGRHDFADTWQPLASLTKPSSKAVSHLRATKFDAFKLDESDLRQALALAPMEFTAAAAQPVEVTIPAPQGSGAGDGQRFAVVETMVMDPLLAAKFPGIKTYRGQGVDDPAATVRLDLTPLGFHAQVLAPGAAYYIDPYWHLSKSVYASYWRKDVEGKPHDADDVVIDQTAAAEVPLPEDAELSSGLKLRTFRTAVAATGEYTAFFGGTVAAGQAAIVTSINRVSGIYESELSIRLTLVANNSSLVYTNSGTDPYTNNNGSTMLGQNQTNITNVIGSANYDIGHVFSTGGGGIAGLGVVGISSQKARGVTGSPAPVGDAFDVDYVAHEMGHQFGGPHTFNTSSAGSNRDGSHAYEPGSGTSIMGYAGITGDNSDLALHSDPFFHADSFNSIIGFVDSSIPSVGVRTDTGNAIPTVNAGVDRVIPTGTPFALTASGSDANAGDVLTYDWEQMDLGPAALLNAADDGMIPLFRQYNPTTNSTRTFPLLASILAGSSTTAAPFGGAAERLPTVARPSMDFRVTVRDNRSGGAGVNSDNMVVNVVNTGSAFLITSQGSAATLPGNSTQTVTWSVAGTTANGINATNVNIRLSTDGGNTFPTFLASNIVNDGTESVTIPNTATTQARIKVEPTNNIFFDINNANLTITATQAPSATPGTPDLLAATDSGSPPFDTDDRTNRDNSTVAKNLQFSVSGTVNNATVTIYADNVAIGSATAGGTTTTVTTNGTADLADGARSITARQTESSKSESPNSAALSVTIDTAAPTADVVNVSPDPRTTGVASIDVTFNESVVGLDLADLSLTRNAVAVTLGASQAPTGSGANYTVPNLTSLTSISGNYTLTLTAAGSGIADVAGNAFTANASDSWIHSLPTWLTASMNNATWNSSTKALTVTGPATITADPGTDDPAITVSGASAALTMSPTGSNRVRIASLNLNTGATATLTSLGAGRTAANHRVLLVDGAAGLSVTGASKLDLTDNDLILDYTGVTSPLAAANALLLSGYSAGSWTGAGIVSSTAAGNDDFALGIAENMALPVPFGSAQGGPPFAGQQVDATAVLIKFTWVSDLDLNGLVEFQDLSVFNTNYNAGATSGRSWIQGDRNYDGFIDFQDLSLFNTGYDTTKPAV